MELVTKHQIIYSNKEPIPLGEIAESLLSLEKIIKLSPPILENLFPEVKIFSVNIFIEELRNGSLYEDLFVKFFFGNQTQMDECINSARKMLRIEYLSNHPKLFATVILSMILAGGIYAQKGSSIFPNSKNTEKLEATNTIVIDFGAKLAEMPSEEFKIVIENGIKDKDQLAKNSVKIIRPARKDPNASIVFDNEKALSLLPETIKAMPNFEIEDEPQEIMEHFHDIELSIRAIDLDSYKKGWAAIIPSLHERRAKLHIDPSINPKELMAKPDIIGDVMVVFKIDENGNKIPHIIYLQNINHEKQKELPERPKRKLTI